LLSSPHGRKEAQSPLLRETSAPALGNPTPDPVLNVVRERVLETGISDGTSLADPLGDLDADAVAREEHRGLAPSTATIDHPAATARVHHVPLVDRRWHPSEAGLELVAILVRLGVRNRLSLTRGVLPARLVTPRPG